MASVPLYALTADLAAIVDELVAAGGEASPDLVARLDSVEADIEAKVDRCAAAIRNLDAEADKHQKEADRQSALRRARSNAAASLREYVKRCLESVDRQRVGAVAIVPNSVPSIEWTLPLSELPAQFQKPPRVEVDHAAARDWYKLHGSLPEGFRVERGTHLRLG